MLLLLVINTVYLICRMYSVRLIRSKYHKSGCKDHVDIEIVLCIRPAPDYYV